MKNFRDDFPIFRNIKIHYLDNAATTQKPQRVIDRIKYFYENENANTHRGIYRLSEKATSMAGESRKIIAGFINAEPDEIIFVRNTTEGINQIANSLSENIKQNNNIIENNNIITTELEHHSNFIPWQQLAKNKGCGFRVVKYDIQKNNIGDISEYVDENTVIVAFTAMSNATGLILDAKDIIKKIRSKNKNAIIIIDAAQAIAHERIDVKKIDCDFLCFSMHKLYGPNVGVVYGKRKILEKLRPFFYGGNMISAVSLDDSTWAELPEKFEAGTLDAAGIIASGEAVKYFDDNFETIMRIEDELKVYLLDGLRKNPEINIIGHDDADGYGPIASFTIEGLHPHDIAEIADRKDVCIRAGHHCCQPLMDKLGITGTCRASLSFYNTRDDVDALIRSLHEALRILK